MQRAPLKLQRYLGLLLLTLSLPFLLGATITDHAQWWKDNLPPAVISGCLLAVPSSSLTLDAFACRAYVDDGTTRKGIAQAAVAVGPLAATAGENYILVHKDTSSVVAGWTRQFGTHYLWQLSASLPATPAGGLMVARVTVAASIISAVTPVTAADPARIGYVNVLDPRFGVVADGVTDDLAALNFAEEAALEQGKGLWFPGGRSYAFDGQFGVRVSVECGVGATLVPLEATPGSWWSTLSNWHVASGDQNDDLIFRGCTVEATGNTAGIYVESCERCLIENMTLNNVINAGIKANNGNHDIVIRRNKISGVIYHSTGADGIYVEEANRAQIYENVIDDVRRIGIVSESQSNQSFSPYIARNFISNTHDSDDTATEHNACIWIENTNGGIIEANQCRDIGGNAGQTLQGPFGIVVGPGTTTQDTIIIRDNIIDFGAGVLASGHGIVLDGSGNFNHTVISGGKIAYVTTGISVGTGNGNVVIKDVLFDKLTYTGATNGAIVVDGVLAADLTIRDITLRNITKTHADAQDLAFISSGGATKVDISGVNQMGIVTGGTNSSILEMHITDSVIRVGTSVNAGAFEAGIVTLDSVEVQITAGRTENIFSTGGVGTNVQVSNSIFNGIVTTIGGTASSTFQFDNTRFINGSNLSFDQTTNNLKVMVNNCIFDTYDTTHGAIKANLTAASVTEFYIRDSYFTGTLVPPLVKWVNDPDVIVLENNTWGGAVALSDFALSGLHYSRNVQSNGFTAFSDGDTTPSVRGLLTGKTANTGGTTITAFDNGHIGQEITVIINDAVTIIDFTGTTLKGNGGSDLTGAAGDRLTCLYDGTNWYCLVSES